MCYTVKTIFQTSGTVKYLSQSNWTQTHFCRIGILYNLSYARISVRYQNYKSNTLIEFAFAHLDLSPMIITIFLMIYGNDFLVHSKTNNMHRGPRIKQ